MQPAITIRNLGKEYTLGSERARYGSLRETLTAAVKAPLKLFSGERAVSPKLWALKDVSVDIQQGDVLGIIGRNGAGKSTLLKMLARITPPSKGTIELHGRVGSLLEVGTGFHPELSGRENIFLSGAILGMTRAETRSKFDAIVAFSDVEKFLDTPLKRYSSGMYMRLAFAVAAHLDPEILLVDEVLAVGDANFQKKCLGKLQELSSVGRTVLFVSHSMPSILRLCRRVILLDKGELIEDGSPEKVTRTYLHSEGGSPAQRSWADVRTAPGDRVARLKAVRCVDGSGQVTESFDIREDVFVEIDYWCLWVGELRPRANVWLTNEDGVVLFVTYDFNNKEWRDAKRSAGVVRTRCRIPGNSLSDGTFFVLAAVGSYNPDIVHAIEADAVAFQIIDRSVGDGVRGEFAGHWPGVVRPMLEWSTRFEPSKEADDLLSEQA